MTVSDKRLFSPSAARNSAPIVTAFKTYMPADGVFLEFASGSGEHALAIANAMPDARWLPSDIDPDARDSINAWRAHSGLSAIAPPLDLDAADDNWTTKINERVDGVVAINMAHISPIAATRGLLKGAKQVLKENGAIFLYGPYKRHGEHTAPSNLDFDKSLKARNPEWGVRDLEGEIIPIACEAGFTLFEAVPMPANNFSLIFHRSGKE